MTFAPLLAALMLLPQAPVAARGDMVSVNYRITFLNGQILDSTHNDAPFGFVLGERDFVRGYTRLAFAELDKQIEGMKAGESKKFDLKGDQAFGGLKVGDVPANGTLSVELSVLEIRKAGEAPKVKIEDLTHGSGEAAANGKKVSVLYKGTFLNGVVFDSSYNKKTPEGEPVEPSPISFTLGERGIIAGFSQGIAGMKVGGKRRITIPHELAYGPGGSERIPPRTTLVFEIELVAVE